MCAVIVVDVVVDVEIAPPPTQRMHVVYMLAA
jgi:hypothetical protein